MANERGQIGVRVVPNSQLFRRDLEKVLDRAEKTMPMKLGVDLSKAKDSIDKFRAKMAGTRLDLDLDVNTRSAERDLDDLADERTATINADADTGMASARLTAITRPRIVPLNVKLNSKPLKLVATQLAALSGARLIGDGIRNLGTSLQNLDRSLPKIAAVSLGIAGIGAAGLSSLQGVLALAGGLSAVAGAGLVIPALYAAIGTSAIVLTTVLKDGATQLESLKGSFEQLQKQMSQDFWGKATAPIKDFVNTVLPRATSGLREVSTALGGFTAELANSLTAALTQDTLNTLFGNLSTSINIAKNAMAPLVQAFTTLGIVGGAYLPRMAQGFANISKQFNGWVQANAANGNLTQWIDNGIAALKTLGSIIGSVTSILGGLINAANAAGTGNGLTVFAGALSRIAEIINGPAFQGALTTFFTGASAGMSAIGAALGPIGDMFVALAPTIAGVMETAGQAIGGLLTQLAGALSQPVFATGLTALFDGLAAGIAAIGPALPALAAAFGTLATFAGQLAAQLGPVLGMAISVLAPIVTQLLNAVMPLIPVLGQMLMTAIQAVAPIIQALVPIIASIIPAVTAVVSAIGPLIQILAAVLGPVIQVVATIVASFVTQFVNGIRDVVQGVTTFLNGLITFLKGVFTGNWKMIWEGIKQMLSGAVQAIWGFINVWIVGKMVGGVKAALTGIKGIFTNVWNGIKTFLNNVWRNMTSGVGSSLSSLASRISSVLSGIRSAWNAMWSAIGNFLRGAWSNITSAVSSGVQNVLGFFRALPGQILGLLSRLPSQLLGIGKNLIQGLINGIKNMAGAVGGAISNVVSGAVDKAKSFLGIHSPSRLFRDEIGEQVGAGWAIGIERSGSDVEGAVAGVGKSALKEAKSLDLSSSVEATATGAAAGGLGGALAGGGIQLVIQGDLVVRDDSDITRIGQDLFARVQRAGAALGQVNLGGAVS